MPEPEPVGLYVKLTPPFWASKASPSTPMTFSMEVEPSVDTVPDTVSEASSSAAGAAAGAAASVGDAAAAAAGAAASVGDAEASAVFWAHPVRADAAKTAVSAREISFIDVFILYSSLLCLMDRGLSDRIFMIGPKCQVCYPGIVKSV